jgi:hypothetical protein
VLYHVFLVILFPYIIIECPYIIIVQKEEKMRKIVKGNEKKVMKKHGREGA